LCGGRRCPLIGHELRAGHEILGTTRPRRSRARFPQAQARTQLGELHGPRSIRYVHAVFPIPSEPALDPPAAPRRGRPRTDMPDRARQPGFQRRRGSAPVEPAGQDVRRQALHPVREPYCARAIRHDWSSGCVRARPPEWSDAARERHSPSGDANGYSHALAISGDGSHARISSSAAVRRSPCRARCRPEGGRGTTK